MPLAIGASKSTGMDWSNLNKRGQDFTRIAGKQAMIREGCKGAGAGAEWWQNNSRASSKSSQRKAWSAAIAKIPLPLAHHIARVYKPNCSTWRT